MGTEAQKGELMGKEEMPEKRRETICPIYRNRLHAHRGKEGNRGRFRGPLSKTSRYLLEKGRTERPASFSGVGRA